MNLLFLLRTCEVGGIGVVTSTLANKFIEEGHHVVLASFLKPPAEMLAKFDKKVVVESLGAYTNNDEIVSNLRTLLISNKVDLIINQLGLPFLPCKVINKAKKGLNIKTIAFYHNSPDTNARIKDVEIALSEVHNPLKKAMLYAKMFAFKQITSRSMKYVYQHTDLYMVLSPSFVKKFKEFTGITHPDHLQVLTNPVTIDSSSYDYSLSKKQKEIIYMGRIDYNQKRVYRVVDTWAKLEPVFPDWKLTIVGDGTARKDIEKQVKEYGLQRVSFEGFQQPKPYYERASILMLTSEYEGFPLVLAECMSFGVVPAVYGSYSAVYDIVNDGVNGIVFPYNKEGFSAEDAARRMERIMADETVYKNMAEKAIETSKRYSINEIYKSWKETFNRLCK